MPKEAKPKAAKVIKEKKAAAPKAKKDPNAPKRGLSAYMFFSTAQRAATKEANPEATFGELGKLLGAAWKETDEETRKPYVILAEADKERYTEAMKTYKPAVKETAGDDSDEKPKKAPRKKVEKVAKPAESEEEGSEVESD